ncbi:MAG TPA: lipid IV(A) 3-deoxy-D-manno-octulosonic acid transferase [Burkholderiaceae bacterium]|nr:lipid IV(A) 3-deoxy-D-manno-octulosonic acid transferase [Burkholderiaceae bacterium]
MSLARAGYTVLVWLAMPFAALYLLWRSRRQPEYRVHWGERFGWARYRDAAAAGRPIWIHAVSVGETRAAEPLITALAQRYPTRRFLLTHMTPTGRATGAQLAARWPGRVTQTYLPYDLPFAVRRFLRARAPVIGLGLETETWPNLLAEAGRAGVPMVLVNARLSERSLARARRLGPLMRETADRFTLVLAQAEPDAARMRAIRRGPVEVVGNLKFDYTPDAALVERGRAWRRSLADCRVLLFASTREGEEDLLLKALTASDAIAQGPFAVLMVPRHPQRFDEVARLIEMRGLRVLRRSARADWNAEGVGGGTVVLGDSMGEMAMYYASCDVACIGGSLLPLGGQNLIEACAVGAPLVAGPHMFNFSQAMADAVAAGAAQPVADAASAVDAMVSIAGDAARHAAMSQAALRFAARHRGATARTVERIAPLIDAAELPAARR